MGLAELLRKTVLGAALAFSSGSAGCTKPNFRESRVAAEQGLTNQQGEVSFSNQVVAQVQDGTAQLPLENMVVHYLHAGSENTLLAIDPQGNYYPNLASFASGETTERRRRKPRKIIIELEQVQEGMEAGQAIVDAFTYQGGDILGEDENYFKYCMSMEDILTTTIDLPAGIILIAPKLVYGAIAEFVASAGTTALKEMVSTFIVAEYGPQPGYEVHSPKRAQSICGEEYEDIICDISGDKLQQLWSPDLPYWQIVGGCTPKEKQGDGGGKGFCSAYFEMCPPQNEEDYEIKEGCPKVCNESVSPRDQPFPPYYICPILACAVETSHCETKNPQVIACLDQYGWCDNPEFRDCE